jgi:hypothetical protein
MRLTRLPAALVTAVLLAGAASCATTIEGSGTIASDVVTGGPTPTGGAGSEDPSSSADPGSSDDPAPSSSSSTASAVRVRERTLCALERAAIAGINTNFNKSKQRSQQVQILRQGSAALAAQLSRSGLPADDAVLRAGKAVQTQLARLFAAANAGKSPSTKPYNEATATFQRACNAIP